MSPRRGPAEHSGASTAGGACVSFRPARPASQITCRDEQSLFPWDEGRKQEQPVHGQTYGRTGEHQAGELGMGPRKWATGICRVYSQCPLTDHNQVYPSSGVLGSP